MTIAKASLKTTPVYLAVMCVILLVYGFLFPALNSPDEYRNVRLLQEGKDSGYAFIYGHFARSVMGAADTLLGLNELIDVLGAIQPNSGFQMIHGALHYKTISSVPAVFYFAKFANFALVGVFAAVMTLFLCGTGRPHQDKEVRVFLLSLCFPSVAYGVMQISTDILFILFSLVPFFLRDRAASIAFAMVMALLAVEDHGFLLLSAFVLLREFYGALLFHRIEAASWKKRLSWLMFFLAATIVSAYLTSRLLVNPWFLNLLHPGLGDAVSLAFEYLHSKSYNPAISLVVFYAGFILMPGATEFFVSMLPLYLILLFASYKFLAFCLSSRYGEAGMRAFIALLSVLTIFFFLTGVVHVFESGRYYLYLVPYVVHAMLSGAVRFKGVDSLKAEGVMLCGCTLTAVTVTLLAYVLGA